MMRAGCPFFVAIKSAFVMSRLDENNLPQWMPKEGEYCQRHFSVGPSASIERNRANDDATEENRTVATINTADRDSYGTIIKAKGADFSAYEQNPIVLINHNRSLLAATSTVSVRGEKIVGTTMDEDWDLEDPEILRYYRKIKRKLMRGVSIAFQTIETERQLIDPDGDPYDWKNIQIVITKWMLREWSFVTIPSNPNALVTQRQLEAGGLHVPADFQKVMVSMAGLSERLETTIKQIEALTVRAGLVSDDETRNADDLEPQTLADDAATTEPETNPTPPQPASDDARADVPAVADVPADVPVLVSLDDLRVYASDLAAARARTLDMHAKRLLGKA